MTDARGLPELPELLALVADGLGMGAAVALAQKLGGQRIYVGKSPRDQHRLARLLGLETAQFLARHFGGEYISVPNGRRSGPQARQRRQAVAASGASSNQLAAELGVTQRHIFKLRRKIALQDGQGDADGDTRQGDLFGSAEWRADEGEPVQREKSRAART